MKVGTDAVLLGSWVDPGYARRILDIGTGTGVIALMLAQRSSAVIDAIDIDEHACEQAKDNVQHSRWSERVYIHNVSFQQFSPPKKYDLIVSNPPYFIDSYKASKLDRITARHADLLPYSELLEGVLKLLDRNGRFCMVLPYKEGELFRDMAEKKKLFLTQLMRVRSRADKLTDKRLLMQFELERNSFSEKSLVIECDKTRTYTEDYKRLTRDYYLAF